MALSIHGFYVMIILKLFMLFLCEPLNVFNLKNKNVLLSQINVRNLLKYIVLTKLSLVYATDVIKVNFIMKFVNK